MSWDGVPWAIGKEGAEHSTNVARNVAFAAFGGREGIVSPTDCEVRELEVPGTSVRVFPGTVAIKNRAAGARDEMYVARLPVQDTVQIAPTDSLGPRSDLIVARVEDPSILSEGWPVPEDVVNGPYVFTRVIPNVSPTAKSAADAGLGDSCYALARIDLPASTGTVTQDLITDLRSLSQKSSYRTLNLVSPTGTENMNTADFTNWPNQGNFWIDIPEWATHAKVIAHLSGIGYGAAGSGPYNVWGQLRIQLGLEAEGAAFGQPVTYNLSHAAGEDRATLMVGAPNLHVPTSIRGKQGYIRIEAKKTGGNDKLFSDVRSMISIDVEFVNAADTNNN